MRKTIKLKDAVGTTLAHDITEIRPGEFKGPAFRKGHTVCDEDICHLQRLGKNHLYVIDLAEDEIHENEAAAILANALSGEGVVWKYDPREGKIELLAGATEVYYGAAALPGAMFLTAYLGEVPLLGVPACGLHHRTTVLDLVLPRILAGERINGKDLALLGHGGLCRDCPECSYPGCSFGKGF